MSRNKIKILSTKEKVTRLKSLIKDAKDLKFEPKLIKNFEGQLREQEKILEEDEEIRKARLRKVGRKKRSKGE